MDFGKYIRKFSILPNIYYLYLVSSDYMCELLVVLFVTFKIAFESFRRITVGNLYVLSLFFWDPSHPFGKKS